MSSVHVLSVDGSHWVREEDYRKVEFELAEARAALREIALSQCDFLTHGHNRVHWGPWEWECFWRDHAAAIKAAREASE